MARSVWIRDARPRAACPSGRRGGGSFIPVPGATSNGPSNVGRSALAWTLLQRAMVGMTITPETTLLELVTSVNEFVTSEAELLATVVYLVNTGSVVLCGTFQGHTFDPSGLPSGPVATAV